MATRAYSKDDFELLKVERSGGMSRIQQARLKETGEICALKVGRVERADDAATASFAREVKALTDMEHRHVVRLIGIGSDGMQRFLVLEWLDETLADYIQDRPGYRPTSVELLLREHWPADFGGVAVRPSTSMCSPGSEAAQRHVQPKARGQDHRLRYRSRHGRCPDGTDVRRCRLGAVDAWGA